MTAMAWRALAQLALAFAVFVAPAPALALETTDKLSPMALSAVRKGLEHLAANQKPDGSWGNGSMGITAASALAMMAQGNVPGSGEYGPQVAKAIGFILSRAQPDGLLFTSNMDAGPMYHHGLGTLALAECWGQTGDKRVRECLRRAVDLICTTQNQKGGWRYQPKISDDDLSVTVMQLMALRAAQDAGMDIPKEVISGGIEYVKRCHNSKGSGRDGGFSYAAGGGESGWARTGAGITSLQVAGNYRATEVTEGIEYILQHKPIGDKDAGKEHYYYGIYYCTMGLYQGQALGAFGKRTWAQYYPAVVKDLCARQKPNGLWEGGHAPYPNAMAVLCLSIPYRYLPIYQR